MGISTQPQDTKCTSIHYRTAPPIHTAVGAQSPRRGSCNQAQLTWSWFENHAEYTAASAVLAPRPLLEGEHSILFTDSRSYLSAPEYSLYIL